MELGASGTPGERPAVRWWRGLTGSLAAGLVVLALVVLGITLLSTAPGPGAVSLIGHPVAAVVAVAAQWIADHRRGRVAGIAGLVVVADTVLAMSLFWWF
nr:hypothetical protein [Amycolatopsis anabasis]